MTSLQEARIAEIGKLGYSPREATFLATAALHSGSFVMKHFQRFIGLDKHRGGSTSGFSTKVIQKRHAKAFRSLRSNTTIYQIRQPIFTCLGEPDNKNRRLPQDEIIRRRMIALDFVLLHPQYEYLPTESDKMHYFADSLRLPTHVLPDQRYASTTRTGASTTRYFVHKMPMAPIPGGALFAYIDSDGSMVSFGNFLKHYRPLFAAIPTVKLIFVTLTSTIIPAALETFSNKRDAVVQSEDFVELEIDFRERLALEKISLNEITAVDLKRLKYLRDTLNPSLYDRWAMHGMEDLRRESEAKQARGGTSHVQFQPCVLESDYNFLGGI